MKTDSLDELLNSQDSFTLADFRAAMPDVPEQTMVSRVHALCKKGVIRPEGGGHYAKGRKLSYRVNPSEKMKDVSQTLNDCLPGVGFCLYERDLNLFVEVSKSDVGRVVAMLKSRYAQVAEFKAVADALEVLNGCILVKPMTSGSTVLEMDGVPVPALEKMLVDMVADAGRLFIDDETIQKSFQRAFEVYEIQLTRMMRYAGRRHVTDEVEGFIGLLNHERIETITRLQAALAEEPIDRAWLFGSYARGEERPDSDLDLLVVFTPEAKVSVLGHSRVELHLEDRMRKDIDLVTDGTVLPTILPYVNLDKLLIYERVG